VGRAAGDHQDALIFSDMFTWLRSLFGSACVVELSSRRILVRDLGTGQQHEFAPVLSIDASDIVASIGHPISAAAVKTFEPFASPEELEKNERVAELLIQYAFSKIESYRWIKPAPAALLCVPMDPANAISSVDDAVLLKLAARAGARRTAIHRGDRLSEHSAKTILSEA
jgi:hypothetical protein